MSEIKFTPGPWRLTESINIGNGIEAQSGKQSYGSDSGYRIVCTYQDCCSADLYADQQENRAANGYLIAAAPDLYAALADIVALEAYCDDRKDGPLFETAKAALAKARGKK